MRYALVSTESDVSETPPPSEAKQPLTEPELTQPRNKSSPILLSGVIVGDLDDALTASNGIGIGRVGRGGKNGHGGGGSGADSGYRQSSGRQDAEPPAAKPSLARPAHLIYPSRDRETREDRLFVVILNVDAKGYVSGVRLKKGLDFHSNGKALDAVWRFRYDPAHDDDGKPVASVVTQKFMLNW